MTYRLGCESLWLLILALALVLAVPAGAQEANPPLASDSAAVIPSEAVEPEELTRARSILAEADSVWMRLRGMLDEATDDLGTEEREILRVGALELIEAAEDRTHELVRLIERLDQDGEPTDSLRIAGVSQVRARMGFYLRGIERSVNRLADLRRGRADLPVVELVDFETRIAREREILDRVMSWATDNAYALKSLGGDAEKTFRSLDRELEERAESLAGRLQVAVLERDRLRAQMKSAEDTGNSDQAAELKSRLRASETRIHGVSESLNRTIDLLNRRGRNTAEYGQVVIQATGEITEDILNPRVLLGLMRDAWKDTLRWFRDQGPGIGVKLLILLVFVLLFRIGAVLIWGAFRMFQGREKSQLLTDLVGRMLRPVATFLGLGAGLWFLGVNPATLLAGVGVAGLIIGFALQDSLSNLAAGVFILVYRPYDVDDIVFAGGVEGRVKQMGLANTTILTFDNRKLFVPNTKIWGEVIENRSAEKIRRVETIVRISNQDDLEGAFEIIRTALEEFEGVHAEPVPSVFVANFADFWIEIGVWTWVDSTSVWSIKTQLRPFLRKKLQDNGIQLPFRHTAEGLRET